jgi:hypothetical protein
MRGLEVMLLMFCIVIALPIAALMLPTYNGGSGIPTGTEDLSTVNAFNWSKLDNYELPQTPSIIQQAEYYFQFAILAITGIATILFNAVKTAPSLLRIFGVDPLITIAVLSLLAVLILITWYQIVKGDDWSGRR